MQEFKIRVVSGNQREIQDALFAAGYAWRGHSHKADGKYAWPLAIGYTADHGGEIRACVFEYAFDTCAKEEFVLQDGKFVKKGEEAEKIFVKTKTAVERKKVLKALADMGYEEIAADWYTGDINVEFHAGYFYNTSITANAYHGWAEMQETLDKHAAVEYVLGHDDKLYPKVQEPQKPEESTKEVIPESVRRACRTELADQLHKASRALELGKDPSIETWEAIFELKEFLSKP